MILQNRLNLVISIIHFLISHIRYCDITKIEFVISHNLIYLVIPLNRLCDKNRFNCAIKTALNGIVKRHYIRVCARL